VQDVAKVVITGNTIPGVMGVRNEPVRFSYAALRTGSRIRAPDPSRSSHMLNRFFMRYRTAGRPGKGCRNLGGNHEREITHAFLISL